LADNWHTASSKTSGKLRFLTDYQSLHQVIRSIVEAYLRLLGMPKATSKRTSRTRRVIS